MSGERTVISNLVVFLYAPIVLQVISFLNVSASAEKNLLKASEKKKTDKYGGNC